MSFLVIADLCRDVCGGVVDRSVLDAGELAEIGSPSFSDMAPLVNLTCSSAL